MSNYKRKEVMDYLTRKPVTSEDIKLAASRFQLTETSPQILATSDEERVLYKEPFYQQPKQLIQDDSASPQVDDIPLYQGVQPGVAIEERMPTYVPPDMSPVTPSAPGIPNPQDRQIELATGGRVKLKDGTKQPPKFIPMDLESVAFKLFKNNLDNLTYNEKQILYDYIEENRNKKAMGGRIKLKKGSEETYNPEIPSLGETDPIGILEQQLINEKDPTIALALDYQLEKLKKTSKAKEMEREEFKKSQKEKGVKYKEDFPSEADYFLETGKQLTTNPKYFLGKGAKGIVEGTEFLVGQPLKTLFSQEGKNFEFYQPVAGEKLGINKFIEKNVPRNPTTGTLLAGDVAEITGSLADPFLAYGVGKAFLKKVEKRTKNRKPND
jgi:hypothetical protein